MQNFDINVNKLFSPEENNLTRKSISYFASNMDTSSFSIKVWHHKNIFSCFHEDKTMNGFLSLKKALNTTVKKTQTFIHFQDVTYG